MGFSSAYKRPFTAWWFLVAGLKLKSEIAPMSRFLFTDFLMGSAVWLFTGRPLIPSRLLSSDYSCRSQRLERANSRQVQLDNSSCSSNALASRPKPSTWYEPAFFALNIKNLISEISITTLWAVAPTIFPDCTTPCSKSTGERPNVQSILQISLNF